jgi:hypothetical protein
MIVQASRPVFTAMIHHRRAYALFKHGSLDDALSDVNLAIRATARIKEPDMHYLKTDIQLAMGDYAGAVKTYEEAVAIAVKARPLNKRWSTKLEEEMIRVLQSLVPKASIFQGKAMDPVDLPNEIFELVLQHGLATDEYFALRASWVSRTWRTTIHSTSSLWRTYTYNPGAKQTTTDKRKAWTSYAGNRFNEIRLVDVDSVTAMKKINNAWKPVLKDLKTLTLRGTTMRRDDAVKQLGRAHAETYTLKRLNVEPFSQSDYTSNELDLGLLSKDNRASIESISVRGITFSPVLSENGSVETLDAEYTSLRELSLGKCYFAQVHSYNWDPTPAGKPQTDPLHQVLRTAVNLEILDFSSPYLLFGHYTTLDRPLVELEHLHTLRIPPPSLWTIDIKTPRLRHLAFDLMQSVDRSRHMVAEKAATYDRGLVPSLETIAAMEIDVAKLVTVELVINGSDSQERIHSWLRAMSDVENLIIRSPRLSSGTISQLSPYYSPTESKLEEVSAGLDPATTANRSVIMLLQQDAGLCPKLKELRLVNIYTPETTLLDWIQDRKRRQDVAEIQMLSLAHCTYISSTANRQLGREVPEYSNVEHGGISRLGWKELCENWDEDVKNPGKTTVSQDCEAVVSIDEADVKCKNEG